MSITQDGAIPASQDRSAALRVEPEAGLEQSPLPHIAGPWRFEMHAAFGGTIAGERMPFGYISTPVCSPLFELDHFFDVPHATLVEAADLMAAAPDLLDALKLLLEEEQSLPVQWFKPATVRKAQAAIGKARAALAKATGAA